ncbi:MAG TPA: M20 family metallo-hydrolase [Bacillota bacterium]|nr:M20 family metallo-hydrolase [Bacillota bacterium]
MVNIKRIMSRLDELARFNATPGNGISRPSFTPEDRQARNWFIKQVEELGLCVRTDGAGNIFARLEAGAGGAVLTGSHLDSVPNGGKLDGALGVVLALEVAEQLLPHRANLQSPLELVMWSDEEGARFNTGLFGSRAATGQVSQDELQTTVDHDGVVLADALQGFAEGDISTALLDGSCYRGYFEVHIEQGARLIEEGYQVGIVQGIVGIARLIVTIKGQANHAGTTPMNRRRDALHTAAQVVLATRELGLKHMPGVATVGVLKPLPGAVNVIPGEVELSIEIRHIADDLIESMVTQAEAMVADICAADGLQSSVRRIKSSHPSPTDEAFRALLTTAADKLGYTHLALPSGAGHDAQSLARIMPIGMLFVPSIGGISHSPFEDSHPEDIAAVANVLLETISNVLGLSAL